MAMTRFLLVWIVFSTKNIGGYLHQVTHRLFSALKTFFCWVLRFCNVRLVLAIARGLCFLGVLGREFRHQNPVATQNFHCLTGQKGASMRHGLRYGAKFLRPAQRGHKTQKCYSSLPPVLNSSMRP